MREPRRVASFGIALMLFLAAVVGTAALSSFDYSWEAWRPAVCMPDDCFCEKLRPGPIRQPVNTWTSLSFVLLGLAVMAIANVDASRSSLDSPSSGGKITATPVYSVIYGFAAVVIGLGGTFYHASMSLLGLWFDLMGMYLFANFMVLYNISRLGHLGPTPFVLWYVIANLAGALLLVVRPDVGRHGFGLILLVALVSDAAVRRKMDLIVDTRLLLGAIGLFLIAFLIWTLDLARVVCSPESWLQGHGLWHILTAAAVGLVYLYFRSEEPAPRLTS